MKVAAALAAYPETVTVFRRHVCPDMHRGVVSLMCRIMSVQAVARVHRIPLTDLLHKFHEVA